VRAAIITGRGRSVPHGARLRENFRCESILKMPKYVIHIGPPKTGTKYLQSSLYRLRQNLLNDGIYYPEVWWTNSEQFSHEELLAQLGKGPPGNLDATFSAFNASSHETILLSCEGLVDLRADQVQYLKRLVNGAPVEIVYYLRRWTDWLPSSWQEMVRQGSTETFPHMLAHLLRGPMNEQAINATLILDRFADAFGNDSIVLGSYSNVIDKSGDIVDDFLRNVLRRNYERAAAPDSVNPSMDPLTTELVRALNSLEAGGPQSRPRFEQALATLVEYGECQADLDLIYGRMGQHMSSISFSDDCAALSPVYRLISEKYGDHLSSPEYGNRLFVAKAREVAYVNSDYMLGEGVVAAIRRVHAAIGRTDRG
jgi:hypothetical protein